MALISLKPHLPRQAVSSPCSWLGSAAICQSSPRQSAERSTAPSEPTRALSLSEEYLWKGQQMLCDRTLARPWPAGLSLPASPTCQEQSRAAAPIPAPGHTNAWLRVQPSPSCSRGCSASPGDPPVHPQRQGCAGGAEPCLACISLWSQSHLCVTAPWS